MKGDIKMADTKLAGKIIDLPLVTGGHFIENSEKRIVYGPDQFWDDYVMRCFTLHPGAASATHSHPWCHWSVCISGEGKFKIGDEVFEYSNGYYAHVPENVPHNFWNASETEDLVLLCIVPKEGDVNPLTQGFC